MVAMFRFYFVMLYDYTSCRCFHFCMEELHTGASFPTAGWHLTVICSFRTDEMYQSPNKSIEFRIFKKELNLLPDTLPGMQ